VSTPNVRGNDMKLEIVVIPVSDVDRAKAFYENLGWRTDIDVANGDFRGVQMTPHNSEASIIFGKGVTSARPGSADEVAQPLDAEFDRIRAQMRTQGSVSKDQLESLERLRMMGNVVGDLPVWPFDRRTMRTFATAYVIPVVVAALTKLAELAIEHAAS